MAGWAGAAWLSALGGWMGLGGVALGSEWLAGAAWLGSEWLAGLGGVALGSEWLAGLGRRGSRGRRHRPGARYRLGAPGLSGPRVHGPLRDLAAAARLPRRLAGRWSAGRVASSG